MINEIDEPPFQGKKVKISYNKRQFYDRILTPMKSMGIIDYNLYSKTYKLSDSFNKELLRIGLQWVQELRRPPIDLKRKSNGPRLPGME